MNADAAARAVLRVAGDPGRREALVAAGARRLERFGTPEQRYDRYLELLLELAAAKGRGRASLA